MPIPRRAIRVTTPVEEKPTPEMETIEVGDLALMFAGGHVLPLTLFPGDEFYNTKDSLQMSLKSASTGEITVIHKQHLLYEVSRKRTIKQVKKIVPVIASAPSVIPTT